MGDKASIRHGEYVNVHKDRKNLIQKLRISMDASTGPTVVIDATALADAAGVLGVLKGVAPVVIDLLESMDDLDEREARALIDLRVLASKLT